MARGTTPAHGSRCAVAAAVERAAAHPPRRIQRCLVQVRLHRPRVPHNTRRIVAGEGGWRVGGSARGVWPWQQDAQPALCHARPRQPAARLPKACRGLQRLPAESARSLEEVEDEQRRKREVQARQRGGGDEGGQHEGEAQRKDRTNNSHHYADHGAAGGVGHGRGAGAPRLYGEGRRAKGRALLCAQRAMALPAARWTAGRPEGGAGCGEQAGPTMLRAHLAQQQAWRTGVRRGLGRAACAVERAAPAALRRTGAGRRGSNMWGGRSIPLTVPSALQAPRQRAAVEPHQRPCASTHTLNGAAAGPGPAAACGASQALPQAQQRCVMAARRLDRGWEARLPCPGGQGGPGRVRRERRQAAAGCRGAPPLGTAPAGCSW